MSTHKHINVLELDDDELAAVSAKLREAGVRTTYRDPAGTALAAMQNQYNPGTALNALRAIGLIGDHAEMPVEEKLAQVLDAAHGARVLLGDLPPDQDHARPA